MDGEIQPPKCLMHYRYRENGRGDKKAKLNRSSKPIYTQAVQKSGRSLEFTISSRSNRGNRIAISCKFVMQMRNWNRLTATRRDAIDGAWIVQSMHQWWFGENGERKHAFPSFSAVAVRFVFEESWKSPRVKGNHRTAIFPFLRVTSRVFRILFWYKL